MGGGGVGGRAGADEKEESVGGRCGVVTVYISWFLRVLHSGFTFPAGLTETTLQILLSSANFYEFYM